MSVFGIFMICWCAGLVLFPTASIISSSDENVFEKFSRPKVEKTAEPPVQEQPVLEAKKEKPAKEKVVKEEAPKKEKKEAKEPVVKKNEPKKTEKQETKTASQNIVLKTVVFNAYNGRQMFVIDGDASKEPFIVHDGKSYLIYFDRKEGSTIFMGASEIPE